ncbi:aminoacyl-tRNA hydrolase, partial [Campylobacter coli]
MILVVGLGNIGKEYEDTRHNVGFMLIDLLLKEGNFTNLTNSKFKGELFKMGSSLLLKPHTYMNNSGLSVKAVNDFYKCERIIVVHDDIDINLGALRFKRGGSSGGHNG